MRIDYVLEALNEALKQKELDMWFKDDNIKTLKKQNEELYAENEKLYAENEKLKEEITKYKAEIKKEW